MKTDEAKTYRVDWRPASKPHDREALYVLAGNEAQAWEKCRAYVLREHQVRKPVFLGVKVI
jgi:hypothetical protein